jgi:hypothetical protein
MRAAQPSQHWHRLTPDTTSSSGMRALIVNAKALCYTEQGNEGEWMDRNGEQETTPASPDGSLGDGELDDGAAVNAQKSGSRAKRVLMVLARIGIVAAILGYLMRTNRLQLGSLGALRYNWHWALYALILFLPQFFLCALRFRLLLGALKLPGTLGQALSWTMIGSFFDLAMPLSNGGDLVKAYYVARNAGKGRRSLAVLSVLLDRVIGLLALFIFAWLVCLFAGRRVDDNPQLLRMSHVLLFVCAGSVAGFIILVSPMLERSAWRKWLMHKLPYHAKFEALYVAFAGLRGHVGTLVLMLLLSLVIQSFGTAGILCLAQGIPFHELGTEILVRLQIVPAMVVLPLALFLNTFGVAGGFGVGEIAFDALFERMLHIRGGADLALAFHCLFALTRLLGIPFVLLYRHREHVQAHRSGEAVAVVETQAGT